MTDRYIVYPNEIPEDYHILNTNKFNYIGISKLAAAIFGTSQILNGFNCTATSPASMSVNVAAGEIYSLQNIDNSNYGSLGTDTVHQILKQGVILDSTNLSITAPSTPGQSINYLIEIAFNEVDGDSAVLPYFNPTNISVPYNGPNNTGASQNTVRFNAVTITLKPGVAATTGTQVTPAVDSGYTGAWVVTSNYGDTSILQGAISQYSASSFILETLIQKVSIPTGDARWAKLSQVQSGSYRFGIDTGTTNALITTLSPSISSYSQGLIFTVLVANTNTGATTINANGIGVANIKNLNGGSLNPGDLAAGMLAELNYDGSNFQLLDTANITSLSLVQQGGYLYSADTGSVNAYVATLSPAPTSYHTGMPIEVNISHTNTSASCTINVNGLGTKNIKLSNGSNLNIGDLLSNMVAHLIYDGTVFQLLNPASWASQFQVQNGSLIYGVDSGTANAYAITLTPSLPSYIAGVFVHVKITHTNTGASTLNINGLGTKNINTIDGNPLPANALLATHIHKFLYDGTQFILMSSERVMPPNSGAFYAYQGTGQTIPSSPTTVTINTVLFDLNSWFNTSLNYFNPKVAGKYFISAGLASNGSGGAYGWQLYKNGSTPLSGGGANAVSSINTSASAVFDLNGSSDYVVMIANAATSITTSAGEGNVYMTGYGPL